VKISFVSIALILCASVSLKAQDEPPLGLQIRQALTAKEPTWKYLAVIQSGRVPIVPSERTVLVGLWQHKQKDRPQEDIVIEIYQVESQAEAIKWLKPTDNGQVAPGWRVDSY